MPSAPRNSSQEEGVYVNHEVASFEEKDRVPIMQRIMDNPFILLFVGVLIPTLFYIIWGIMEIITIPMAR